MTVKYISERKTEVLRDGEWIEIANIGELKMGDAFRLFESDGTPVLDISGETEFYAMEQPFFAENGRFAIGACPMKAWQAYLNGGGKP